MNDVSEDREVVDAFTDDSDEVKVAAGVLDAVPDDDDIVVLRTDCCKSCS